MSGDLDTSEITEWRSIVTLIVFVLTNITVLSPFQIRIYVPRRLSNAVLDSLSGLRVIAPRQDRPRQANNHDRNGKPLPFVLLHFPMNFVTAPLVADLFLLAILAIGRDEVYSGTIGSDHISPIDVMVFFITLAYIAISIDASGLLRYLAYKVLQRGGRGGPKLFFLLYVFFFALGSVIGNDPIILCGTAFLAYMTRASSNIVHPRAWIHTQFAVANIASAILVSSNPTNLVLAGAFSIKFVDYTANMIVPVLLTAIVLFPLLLYVVFADTTLIPHSIEMHELSEEAKAKTPVNPNIPHAKRGAEVEGHSLMDNEQVQLISLEEIMNPFLDKGGAWFGAIIMAATLITVLVVNASSQNTGQQPVFWVTLPAAFVMLCWDLASGWHHRHETREISRNGRRELERARAARAEVEAGRVSLQQEEPNAIELSQPPYNRAYSSLEAHAQDQSDADAVRNGRPSNSIANTGVDVTSVADSKKLLPRPAPPPGGSKDGESPVFDHGSNPPTDSSTSVLVPSDDEFQSVRSKQNPSATDPNMPAQGLLGVALSNERSDKKPTVPSRSLGEDAFRRERERATLVSLAADAYRWSQETFPTATAVISVLPFALVPFAFTMFVLVQGLVSKGWVQVFGYGWDHWVDKTGTVGAIGGMGFVSVMLCNFAGTNIGTTILLSRVIQAWQKIHACNGIPISTRTFWGTVYGMALGVNYGAFSTAFSASLAGLLWRDILARKNIYVLKFAHVNLPIIAIAMTVGCASMIGEMYVMRDDSPFDLSSISVNCS